MNPGNFSKDHIKWLKNTNKNTILARSNNSGPAGSALTPQHCVKDFNYVFCLLCVESRRRVRPLFLNPNPRGPFWSLTSRGFIAIFGS